MNILVLVEDLRINKTSSGIVSSNIIASLLSSGHTIYCIYYYADSDITWFEDKIKFEKLIPTVPSFFWRILKKWRKGDPISYLINGYAINDTYIVKAWKLAVKDAILNGEKFDLILSLGTGSSFLPYFALSKMNLPIKWIANYQDPYPLSLYPEPYKYQGNRIIDAIQQRNSERVLKKAYKVSFPSFRLYEWMSQYYHFLETKYLILPHPHAVFPDLPSCEYDGNLLLDSSKFNLLHIGTLLGPRKPDSLLKAFYTFISQSPEKKAQSILHIVGYDKTATSYSNYPCFNNLNVYKNRISYSYSMQIMQQSSVLIIIEAEAPFSPFMPGKLSDYIIADKPILAISPKQSEVRRLLGGDYAYATENGNEDELVRILNVLWEEWTKNKQLSLNRSDLCGYVSPSYFNKQLMKGIR